MKRYIKISCDSFYSQFQLYFFSNSPLLYTFPIEQLNCLLFDYFRFKISWKLTCQTLAEFKSIFFSKIFSSNNLKVWNCIQHKFIWWQVLLLHIAKGKQTQWNWYFIFYIYFLSFFPAGVGWPLYCTVCTLRCLPYHTLMLQTWSLWKMPDSNPGLLLQPPHLRPMSSGTEVFKSALDSDCT